MKLNLVALSLRIETGILVSVNVIFEFDEAKLVDFFFDFLKILRRLGI